MTPIGYIEIKDGRTRFVPIVHPARMAALFCLAILAALLLIRPPAASRHPRGRRRHYARRLRGLLRSCRRVCTDVRPRAAA